MEQFDFDRAGTASVSFLEELYSEFQKNPENVSADWREYFQSIADTNGDAKSSVVAIAAPISKTNKKNAGTSIDDRPSRGTLGNGHSPVSNSVRFSPEGIPPAFELAGTNGHRVVLGKICGFLLQTISMVLSHSSLGSVVVIFII